VQSIVFFLTSLPDWQEGLGEENEEDQMTDQERNQVLKMIEGGKITAEQGLHLMQALAQSPAEELPPASAAEAPRSETSQVDAQPPKPNIFPDMRVEALKTAARRLWQIPLWIGIAVTILSALGMYAIMQGPGVNFWFYFLLLPLLLGVALTALAAASRTAARWIYVDVHNHPGGHPERFFLGLPLPLKLTAWFLHTFGPFIPELRRTNVDEIIRVIESGFSGNEPLIVHVDQGAAGERVQVYIG
jgi:hypothetical protein